MSEITQEKQKNAIDISGMLNLTAIKNITSQVKKIAKDELTKREKE